MIEKLACELYWALNGPPSEPLSEDQRTPYLQAVRAILTALREPTIDMGLAGADKVNEHMRGAETPADYDAAMDSFKVMIGEILKEGQ